MCKHSLEGYKSRDVQVGETIVAGRHSELSGHGVFTRPTQPGVIACAREGQVLTIERFNTSSRPGYQREFKLVPGTTRLDQRDPLDRIGKRYVVVMREVKRDNIAAHIGECVQFEDGWAVPISFLASGLELYVGVKPTLDEKLGIDAAHMAAASADLSVSPPEPKPDGDEPAPADPKPELEPVTAAGETRNSNADIGGRFGARRWTHF